MNRSIIDRLVLESLRALDGKLGGTYPQMLARRIKLASQVPLDEKNQKEEDAWLGHALFDLAQTNTKSLRQVADALDSMRKDGQVKNEKRYSWLWAYLVAYEEAHCGRPPTMKEIIAGIEMPDDEAKRAYKERAGRKLLNKIGLPITNVPTGRPKGAKDGVSARKQKL